MPETIASEPTREELEATLSDMDAAYEIVDDKILEKPSMGVYAVLVAKVVFLEIHRFLTITNLGVVVQECRFVLDAGRPLRRQPDVAFVSHDRWAEGKSIPRQGDWDVVPDLAIEVLSPHDKDRDVAAKIREYFRYGVREVWLVRPETLEIYVYKSPKQIQVFDVDDALVSEGILPGFRVAMTELFPDAF